MSLTKFLCIFMLIVLAPFAAQAQSARQIESRIEKGNWDGALQLLIKAQKKDTGNVELKWRISQWFYAKANPRRQIDSSYRFINQTIASYRLATERQRERLKREDLDETRFLRFKEKVDSAAFERAKQANAVAAYDFFLEHYTGSNNKDRAIELRNEVAFLEALKTNTFQSFQGYFQKYPQSHRAQEAQSRYEKLLFETKTRDGKLSSFADFVNHYQNSPYRIAAERHVFEIATALGDTTSFFSFLRDYQQNHFRKKAINLLYYLLKESDRLLPAVLENDSLRAIRNANVDFWIPFYSKGKYGFMDSEGKEQIPPTFSSVDAEYKCSVIETDVLITGDGLVARNKKKISDQHQFMQPLGAGFWKVGDSTCVNVIHSSSVRITGVCAKEIELIHNRFLLVHGGASPGLYSLTGRMLIKGNWDQARWIENILVLSHQGKNMLFTKHDLRKFAEGIFIQPEYVFDDVQRVGVDRLLVRNGALEGIVDSSGKFVVPLARQLLTLEPFGLVRKVNDDIFLDEVDPQFAGKRIKKYQHYQPWLLASTEKNRTVWNLQTKRFLPTLDSVWFAAGLLFTKKDDSTSIHFGSSQTLSFENDQKVSLVRSRDSIHAFVANEGKLKKSVFSIADGAKLFTAEFDAIESVDANLFLISRKGKRGILSKTGKVVLPIEYDLLAINKDNYWSTFKDKKFGLIDLATGSLLKPTSTRNVGVLNDKALIIFEKEKCGLMDWKGKPLTKLEYDEILPWRDDLIWVRLNSLWTLLDYVSKKVVIDKVSEFEKWQDLPHEKLYKVQRENFFGVVSIDHGVVIPPTFSYIKNIGSLEKPLFFTDKEVEEAGVHVVIYYNSKGKFIRKEVLEEDEFEALLCND